MVHTPVSIKEALSNNDAKAALEKEWAKFEKGTKSGPAWDMNKPRSKDQVRRDALNSGKKVHFGDLMDLCFEKNSQLGKSKRKYKGRVVFQRRPSQRRRRHFCRLHRPRLEFVSHGEREVP